MNGTHPSFAPLADLLDLSQQEIDAVCQAADDCHMEVLPYCRLMLLCAAGMGGVKEHLERVCDASFEADQAPGIVVRIEKKP